MSMETGLPRRVVVIGNEKGGSGKSTIAMHVAVDLLKSGQSVATVDLDSRQQSLTHYVENRRTWAERVGRDLKIPEHVCISADAADDSAGCLALADAVNGLSQTHTFVVIDTPGHDGNLTRLAHAMADTLITPLNDSFIDFDVLGTVDPDTFAVSGVSHYAKMVGEIRQQRSLAGHGVFDWVVLRNRLSMLSTRNKRLVGAALEELAGQLEFRSIEGLAERMIFREFYPCGLTALDDLDEVTLGTRPTLSHATARLEVANLIRNMSLGFGRDAIGERAGRDDVAVRSSDAA